MRLRFFLCASADLGVRRSKVARSLSSSGYIRLLRENSGHGFLNRAGPLECRAASRLGRDTTILLFHLEVKLQGKLHQTRIFYLGNLAELRAIRAVSIRVVEL